MDPKCFLDATRLQSLDIDGVKSDRPVFRMTGGTEMVTAAADLMIRSSLEEMTRHPGSRFLFAPHQASMPVLNEIERGLTPNPAEPIRMARSFRTHANSVSATVPVTLAMEQDAIEPGTVVICPTAGGGEALRKGTMSHGLVAIRW